MNLFDASRLNLAGVDRADQVQNTVDQGQNTLGICQLIVLGPAEQNIVVVLNEQASGDEEHDATDQAEDDVDALANGRSQEKCCVIWEGYT